jgi:carbonic anhydrase
VFDDLLASNRAYAESFTLKGLPARAAKGLAILTCMDSRIAPLGMVGLAPGDAKILRNAGARVTDDALRTLILATNLLGVDRIAVVAHTDCRMTQATDEELRRIIGEARHADCSDYPFLAVGDQVATLRSDLERIHSCPLIAAEVTAAGFVYDVHSGLLAPID